MTKNRVYYLDMLKILACFAVIMIHVTAANWYTDEISAYWIINNSYNALSKWSVPLFVMVSGALFLSRDIPLKKIFTKYILKMLILLLIWGMAYWCFSERSISPDVLFDSLKKVLSGKVYSHLWYLFMLIGLYLITPIVRGFVRGSERSVILYSIVLLFVIQVAFPYVTSKVSAADSLIKAFRISAPAEYLLYYLAGHYINSFDIKKWKRITLYSLAFSAIIIIVVISDVVSFRQGSPYTIYGYFSAGTSLTAFALFLLMKQSESFLKESKIRNIISFISPLTFGIYLLHFMVIKIFVKFGIDSNMINPIIGAPVTALLVFASSGAVIYVLSKIPVIRKLVQ